ncbi:hypothetical protein Q9314_25560 (plasmid) [Shinella sumterensis]|nr:hypothetical protein Q9314_25560 [Shinella sumterensis]
MTRRKWSGFDVSFRRIFLLFERRVCHEEEAVFGGTDRSGVEAGRAWYAGRGSDPAGRDIGADVLSLEEAVRRA